MVTVVPQPLPLNLSQGSGVPFYRQIEDQLAELIRAGRLARGSALPSVRALAAQLRVSVITTRRAYADLEQDGLVVSRQGQGTFVTDAAGTASKRRARTAGRQVLAEAVSRSRQLGLDDDDIRSELALLLGKPGGPDGRKR
jgi:GntR family transcriptional regulator